MCSTAELTGEKDFLLFSLGSDETFSLFTSDESLAMIAAICYRLESCSLGFF
jgi:hypothetical protein